MESLSKQETIDVCSNILKTSPPGEFNEVFNDIRGLVNNDSLLREGCLPSAVSYNKENYIQSVEDIQPAEHPTYSDALNQWRKAVQKEANIYMDKSFKGVGVASVFAHKDSLVLCIESHQFRPSAYWNGRWRSTWAIPSYNKDGIEITGQLKIHTHYYEDGNVQLINNHDCTAKVTAATSIDYLAGEVMKSIIKSEDTYQMTVQETYMNLIENAFKQIRRQLPIIQTKVDWKKAHAYRIGQDIKPTSQ
uniref:F-actin-capping protein subunit alpha n=1 Tax=Rhabditophanes sp. KR3021 TaxID=114890 RepID=A0AC35THP2_9BILA